MLLAAFSVGLHWPNTFDLCERSSVDEVRRVRAIPRSYLLCFFRRGSRLLNLDRVFDKPKIGHARIL
jgi:hypothetical protein